jgi:RNA polymerase sigma-70 factor, ECF subfamily
MAADVHGDACRETRHEECDRIMLTTPPSLLDRLRQSPERQAWGRFVEMYTPLLFAWAGRLGLTGHDAADLVQDVFTILVEKLPEFRYNADKSFRAWLKTILLNRCRQQRRRQANEKRVDAELAAVAGPDEVPEFEADEYRRHIVGRALALMQAEFQAETWKACWECVAHGRPAAEVAAELRMTPNAVYLARSRVLRRLREELHGLLD